jgi:hypothetical protein
MRNIFRLDSMLCRTVSRFHRLLPIALEHVRVGSNTTDFVRIIWR